MQRGLLHWAFTAIVLLVLDAFNPSAESKDPLDLPIYPFTRVETLVNLGFVGLTTVAAVAWSWPLR